MSSGWRRRNSDLDNWIWSNLPEDLLLRVLACLPIKRLLRLRCLSRRWNDLLTSPAFARLQSEAPTSDLPWILMFQRSCKTLKVFNRSSNRWIRIPLSFLPASTTDLVAASKGLLCFQAINSGEFLICNPLLQSCRRLPRPNSDIISNSVTLLICQSGFEVVVTGSNRWMNRVTEIYSSATDLWRTMSRSPSVSSAFRSETAFCNGQLYFTTRSEPPSVVALDVQRDSWQEIEPLPQHLIYCIPVVANGVLHLVGGLGRYGIAKSMSIWRFCGSDVEKWEEIERMPEGAWTKLAMSCYHNYETISCTSQEDLICVSSCNWCQEMLVFCVAQKCWIWLPVCNQIAGKGLKWFSLEPDLLDC